MHTIFKIGISIYVVSMSCSRFMLSTALVMQRRINDVMRALLHVYARLPRYSEFIYGARKKSENAQLVPVGLFDVIKITR